MRAPILPRLTLDSSVMTVEQKTSEILARRKYFDLHFPPIARCDARNDIPYNLSNSCPICGYMTLQSRCSHEICAFCFWQDDGQDSPDAEREYIGPNDVHSIAAFRIEIYDWMKTLKENISSKDSLEQSIGKELATLDGYINSKKAEEQIVLKQIELLSEMFREHRRFFPDNYPIGSL